MLGELIDFGPSKNEQTLSVVINPSFKSAKVIQRKLGSTQEYREFLSCSISSMRTSLYSYQEFVKSGTDIIFKNEFLAPTSLNLFTNSSVLSKYSLDLTPLNFFKGILYVLKNFDNMICNYCTKSVRLQYYYGDKTMTEHQCFDAVSCALAPMMISLEGGNYSLHDIQLSLLHSLKLRPNSTDLGNEIEKFLEEHSISLTLASTLLLLVLSIFSFLLLLFNRCCSQCSPLSRVFIRPIVRRHVAASVRLSEL